MDLKISVITISYNQSKFLEKAIESVIHQNYDWIEYIIVDPGSNDGSREIIEKYGSKIAKMIFEPDSGPADGLNKGFRYVTGDILFYLNADDELLPGTFESVARYFNDHPDCDVVYAHGYFIDDAGKRYKTFHSDPFDLYRYIYGGVSVMQQSTFFRRSAYEKIKGFNVNNKTCWDGELMLDFGLRRLKIRMFNGYWSCFRIHTDSISGSGRMTEQYKIDLENMFVKGLHRKPMWFDQLIFIYIRMEKAIRHPIRTIKKLMALIKRKLA